mgnify:CR=1 FL=1|tara:strand:+ start:722 stop:1708 length:987 start_codon:yes stop_codon:yes gene_type:complete
MEDAIIRLKRNDNFIYIKNNKELDDETDLLRIKKLRIPPAWNKVFIAQDEDNYMQVIGKDEANRTQYIYHKSWIKQQERDKFIRLIYFSKNIKFIRKDLRAILKEPEWNRNKLIAFIINIIDECGLRIGNEKYQKLYDSFGITTLLKKHVIIKNNEVLLDFIGKKKVENTCILKKPLNIRLFKSLYKQFNHSCDDQFFVYMYKDRKKILDNKSINNYIKDFGDFTIKDFRTFRANTDLIKLLYNQEIEETKTGLKRTLNYCLDKIADKLNNTRTVLKNKYICSFLLEKYLEDPVLFIKNIRKYKSKPLKDNDQFESALIYYLSKYKRM